MMYINDMRDDLATLYNPKDWDDRQEIHWLKHYATDSEITELHREYFPEMYE